MREFSNHAVLSMSDSTMAVSSKYTQDLSVQIVFFTFSCKWFLCFYFWAVIWSYIVDLFAGLHELASTSSRTLQKLASSVRALLKLYGDTLKHVLISCNCTKDIQAGDIKVFCGYLKRVVVVCLRSNFMFLCGRLLGSCSLSSIGLENNY